MWTKCLRPISTQLCFSGSWYLFLICALPWFLHFVREGVGVLTLCKKVADMGPDSTSRSVSLLLPWRMGRDPMENRTPSSFPFPSAGAQY